MDREHGVSLVCRLRGCCKLSHKGDAASDNNTEIRLSGCVPPGTLGEVNACRHLRQPMSTRLSLLGRLRHLTFPSPWSAGRSACLRGPSGLDNNGPLKEAAAFVASEFVVFVGAGRRAPEGKRSGRLRRIHREACAFRVLAHFPIVGSSEYPSEWPRNTCVTIHRQPYGEVGVRLGWQRCRGWTMLLLAVFTV